jgi:hypothetical protein
MTWRQDLKYKSTKTGKMGRQITKLSNPEPNYQPLSKLLFRNVPFRTSHKPVMSKFEYIMGKGYIDIFSGNKGRATFFIHRGQSTSAKTFEDSPDLSVYNQIKSCLRYN